MNLPFTIGEIGRWWGNNVRTKRQVIDTLLERGELFQYPEKYYYLFPKFGFQDTALEYGAQDGRVHLITFEEMCR